MRVLVVGASAATICGVRDCARVLDGALEAAGAETATVWWERDPAAGIRSTRADAAAAAGRIAEATADFEPDAVVWHYSTFAYGPRGVPVAVPAIARAAARIRRPVIPFVHEYARPWGRGGWRGGVQAATQRAVLRRVVATAAAVVVTTDERAQWLRTRRWLPRRTVATLPVPSNVEPLASSAQRNGGPPRIGLFGFGGDAPDVALVAAALARIRLSRPDVELVLVGAPGPDSPAGERWRAAAAAAGVADALAFTGVLREEALSRELAGLDVVVVADDIGPTARRTTLAAVLAHGRAIVAVEGPRTWEQLVGEGAVALSPRDPASLARELDRVLSDDRHRAELERRASAFYDSVAAPAVVARRLLELIEAAA